MGGHQGAEQKARHRGKACQKTNRDAGTNPNQQNQQAINERSTLHPVELLQVDLQPHREQQINRAEIGQQPHGFTAAIHPAQGMGSHQNPCGQQSDQIG